jgi:preprotein translocase subunit YajC
MIRDSMTDLSLLAQGQPNALLNLVPILLMLAIFYFLLFLPMQRQRRKLAAMLAGLKNGDKVVTNGGIYGTVVGLEGDTVQLKIADQVRIKLARSAVASLQLESKEG